MTVPKKLLSILACPKCQGPVSLSGQEGIRCVRCRLQYPVRDGIPVMMVEEATLVGAMAAEINTDSSQATITIQIVEGMNKGLEIPLPRGACRAMGRSLDDAEKTRVFAAGSAIPLNDSTKKLVLSYSTQQFQSPDQEQKSGDFGAFQRLPDIPLTDNAVSRLHAMIFHGPNGIGILDLVSKNGTFVNGVEVESKFLKKSDIVSLGGTKFRIVQREREKSQPS